MMENTSDKKRFEDMRKPLEQKGYQIMKSIGKGAFGQVVLARNMSSDTVYAVKIISKVHIRKKPFLQKYIDQQIDILKKLNHPNIVRYEVQFSTSDFIVIVMEYCEQGNLLNYQAKLPGKVFPMKQALKVVVEVMKGLKCIHQKNFIHRDIKSENVLLKKVGNQITYKIADFGFARSIGGNGAKTHCGTEKYMAPEIISNSYYGISVDIWALGILFYFMLFAEYPFKGHDMKLEIQKKCTPYFALSAVVSKKQKLKDVTPQLQDFFKRIFVIDSKKRLTFSNMVKHPLFAEYEKEVEDNTNFYKKHQKNEQLFKDDVENNVDYDDHDMQPEDETRVGLLKKKLIGIESRHIQRELEQLLFEINKVEYLKECANELFVNYSSYLSFQQRLGVKFYLLKAYLFYSDPLLNSLMANKMPLGLFQIGIDDSKWQECTRSNQYRSALNTLKEENMQAHLDYQDTYSALVPLLKDMTIKNFEKGYRLSIDEKSFDELKFSYRSTTSHIFKRIHENKKIDAHTRNKVKMRLFCCHMINRIFGRGEIGENFPYFKQWLVQRKIEYKHAFDFFYFRKWVLEESKENLEANIALLHRTFF